MLHLAQPYPRRSAVGAGIANHLLKELLSLQILLGCRCQDPQSSGWHLL